MILQDGGTGTVNNPSSIALGELGWLDPSKEVPDLLVSVGSGYSPVDESSSTERPISWMKRLFLALYRTTDGEQTWRTIRSQMMGFCPKRYHRLNVELEADVRLDDLSQFHELKRHARQMSNSNPDIAKVTRTLQTSLFYFELSSVPQNVLNKYICTGSILCRLGRAQDITTVLNSLSGQAFYLRGDPPSCLATIAHGSLLIQSGSPFRIPVRFEVPSLEQSLCMTLGILDGDQYPISSFPRPLCWFIQTQDLCSLFGRNNHIDLRPEANSVAPPFSKRRKRPVLSSRDKAKRERVRHRQFPY